MARSRNIKPAFFINEELGELSAYARLAFIGLWTVCDFRGVVEYKLKRLKLATLPYDNCDFEEIMINLDKSGLIAIYSVQGQQYAKVINFEKHQNPHKNERDAGSTLPDIDMRDDLDEIKPIKTNEVENIEINPDKDGTNPDFDGTTRADSLLLIPDSLNLIPDIQPSAITQGSGHKELNISFDAFWDLYDKKRGLEKSKTMWAALSDLDREQIMACIPKYNRANPDKQFRKDPTTFLSPKNKYWLDEIIESKPIQNQNDKWACLNEPQSTMRDVTPTQGGITYGQ